MSDKHSSDESESEETTEKAAPPAGLLDPAWERQQAKVMSTFILSPCLTSALKNISFKCMSHE